MKDKARVIGSSDPEQQKIRLKSFLDGLGEQMQKILAGEYIAFGRKTGENFYLCIAKNQKTFMLTRNKANKIPEETKFLTLYHDYMELVNRFQDSEEELAVVGDLEVLKLFTPYTKIIDFAETTELVVGNQVFDDWDNGQFELISETA
ncbi:MAG: hypothetical protein GPJ52_00980 [Candidatus Heimdallarchaeota archaeon]|nr:hypothetical protein [Candidatus Heimdallarchaeota archaeon]